MKSSAHSYSSTGSAFGWAIGATATDPPPYVFDCRARMPTSQQHPLERGGGGKFPGGNRKRRRTALVKIGARGVEKEKGEIIRWMMAGEGRRMKMADDDLFGGFGRRNGLR